MATIANGASAAAPAVEDVEARLVAMTQLCRSAWLVSGKSLPSSPRSQWPGEVFEISGAAPR